MVRSGIDDRHPDVTVIVLAGSMGTRIDSDLPKVILVLVEGGRRVDDHSGLARAGLAGGEAHPR